MRDRLRLKHYSPRTEKTYIGWSRRYFNFHNKHACRHGVYH
ncbi:MAG: phage integrase N-terminal SAM-like domain-containing protein [Thiobacillus sp.]